MTVTAGSMSEVEIEAALALVEEGSVLLEIARVMGVRRATLQMTLSRSDVASRYARARNLQYDAIADKLYVMSQDFSLDPKDRKMRLEGGLKFLARWCPERYGEAILLKHENVPAHLALPDEEVVQQLAEYLKRPIPLALEGPIIDGEFTDVVASSHA